MTEYDLPVLIECALAYLGIARQLVHTSCNKQKHSIEKQMENQSGEWFKCGQRTPVGDSEIGYGFFIVHSCTRALTIRWMATLKLEGTLAADQVETLAHWFAGCNDAEQAAVGATLLGRVKPRAAHLLHTLLQVRQQTISDTPTQVHIGHITFDGRFGQLPRLG